MKIKWLFILMPALLMAAGENDQILVSDNEKKIAKNEQTTASQAVSQQITAATQAKSAGAGGMAGGGMGGGGTSDIMIIDPKVMSQDWIEAFQALLLRKGGNITFALKSGGTLTQVTDISALSGGYLLLFTMRTVQGSRWQIVKTSDIVSIGTS